MSSSKSKNEINSAFTFEDNKNIKEKNNDKKVENKEESNFSLLQASLFPERIMKLKELEKEEASKVIHKDKVITLSELKNGRRIFNNKTEATGYDFFNKDFIEFRQLIYENLLLTEDLKENIKEKFTLKSALLCTFVYDESMFEPLIEKFKIKTMIIMDKLSHIKKTPHIDKKSELLTVVYPKIEYTLNWGKFHSKLMLLKFSNFLRVIIPSANLTNIDWYYLGQNIWFQDFKLKSPFQKETKNKCECEFEYYLQNYVINMYLLNTNIKINETIDINIEDYDFSNASVDLVSTISGRFQINLIKASKKPDFKSSVTDKLLNTWNGKVRVKSLISSLNIDNKTDNCFFKLAEQSKQDIKDKQDNKTENSKVKEGINADSKDSSVLKDKEENSNISIKIKNNNNVFIQCSSFGKIKDKWLEDFSYCCSIPSNCISIIYPSLKYIHSSENGEELSSCLFLNEETYNKYISLFRKLEIKDKSSLLIKVKDQVFHSKVIFFNFKDSNSKDNNMFYFGSHNMSPSAWGNLEKKNTQISSGNYELGVFFSSSKLNESELLSIRNSLLFKLEDSIKYKKIDDLESFKKNNYTEYLDNYPYIYQ